MTILAVRHSERMAGIFLTGMLEGWNATVSRMGYDSVAMLVVFFGGGVILYVLGGLASRHRRSLQPLPRCHVSYFQAIGEEKET